MTLQDYRIDIQRCSRCSLCKWLPLSQIKSWRFANACPSMVWGNFHAYSAGGRMIAALALLDGRIDYTDKLVEIVYQCQMDGACDVSCKVNRDMDPLEVMLELRAKCVEEGQVLPAHMVMIESLRSDDNVLGEPKAERGKWAEGLDVKDITKEKADVLYFAGCRYSFDQDLWKIARDAIALLKIAGVDVGIEGKEEACCGGRAFEIGYRGEFTKYAEHSIETWNTADVRTVVTPCSDCYGAFKFHYPRIGKEMNFEVLHITEYLDRLIKEGRLKPIKKVPLKVTYHDPCHLGRLSEPYIPWEGVEKKVLGQVIIKDPPREYRRGTSGIYEPPRDILRSIPGIELLEMERIKEYAWCCGAGGGVKEAYPEFALWTADERIEEAKATGAEALVTACPWCERSFRDALEQNGAKIKLYDIVELLLEAL
ncbi:MAG: (Fe-S)-binding protein [Dehalococcoidia bacterium]|nr:MAG: (Fe-S)-binding protein [Dehalococcoidia bacterium]